MAISSEFISNCVSSEHIICHRIAYMSVVKSIYRCPKACSSFLLLLSLSTHTNADNKYLCLRQAYSANMKNKKKFNGDLTTMWICLTELIVSLFLVIFIIACGCLRKTAGGTAQT